MKRWQSACLVLLSWWLVACQSLPPASGPVPPRSWPEHLVALEHLNAWHLQGKVGWRSRDDGGSAWIDWVQDGDAYTITLSGPLGQGATVIRGDKQFAELESSDGTRRARNAEELLLHQSGLRLPVRHMLHWIRGMPVPDMDDQHTLTDDNTLNALQQDGWEVRCSEYVEALGNRLPGRLKMQGRGLMLTVVVKQWNEPE
jgi:outer membrane lipoprotein LolB